jgi:hypothetical protein
MQAWEVVTTDDEKVGRVVDVLDDYLIVEHGHVRKSRHPLPRSFAHPREAEEQVCVSVPKDVLLDSPKLERDGSFDREATARHYGLAAAMPESPAEGYGDSDADDPAWTSDQDAAAAGMVPTDRLRARIRERKHENRAPRSPSFLGERRRIR